VRAAGDSAAAALSADFAVALARRVPCLAGADDLSFFHAPADLLFVAAEWVRSDTRLIGGPALRSRQDKPFALVHESMAACGDG